MKRLFGITLVLCFSFAWNISSAKASIASVLNSTTTETQTSQEQTKVQKKKSTKLNLNLFRFLTPSSTQKTDSVGVKQKQVSGNLKEETVYEKPLSFFKFSYAS